MSLYLQPTTVIKAWCSQHKQTCTQYLSNDAGGWLCGNTEFIVDPSNRGLGIYHIQKPFLCQALGYIPALGNKRIYYHLFTNQKRHDLLLILASDVGRDSSVKRLATAWMVRESNPGTNITSLLWSSLIEHCGNALGLRASWTPLSSRQPPTLRQCRPLPAELNDHDCKELIQLHWWEEKKSTAITVLFG